MCFCFNSFESMPQIVLILMVFCSLKCRKSEVASGFEIHSVRKVLENGHFLGNFLKIRTRPAHAIENCGRVPRNLVVCTIKNLANTSVYKAFRVVSGGTDSKPTPFALCNIRKFFAGFRCSIFSVLRQLLTCSLFLATRAVAVATSYSPVFLLRKSRANKTEGRWFKACQCLCDQKKNPHTRMGMRIFWQVAPI